QTRDQPLTAPIAIDIGRVDEVDAAVDGGVQRAHRLGIVCCAPEATDGPRAETDARDRHVGAAQPPVFHFLHYGDGPHSSETEIWGPSPFVWRRSQDADRRPMGWPSRQTDPIRSTSRSAGHRAPTSPSAAPRSGAPAGR